MDRIIQEAFVVKIKNQEYKILNKFLGVSSTGGNTLVAAETGYKIIVLAASISANAEVNFNFSDGVAESAISALKYLAAKGGFVWNFNPGGWFITGDSGSLDAYLSADVAVGVEVSYIKIPNDVELK